MLRPTVSKFFTRNLSFNIFKFWGENCDKVECTKPREPVQKYVIQKSCCHSIFETWKPKIPDLNSRNYPTIRDSMMLPYQQKVCTSGMKFLNKSRCEIDANAKECQKTNHPKWLRSCPPKQFKAQEPLPPLKSAMMKCKESKGQAPKPQIIRSLRKKCEPQIPEGDWNPDGHLS